MFSTGKRYRYGVFASYLYLSFVVTTSTSSRVSVDSLLVRTRFLTSIYTSKLQHINNPDQDERAAEASAAMEADEETPSNAAAQPKGGEE